MANDSRTDHYSPTMRDMLTGKRVFLNLVYTVAICFLIAGLETIAGISKPSPATFVMPLSFGISICVIIMLFLRLFNPRPDKTSPVVLIMMAGVICGTLVGLQIGPFILRRLFSVTVDASRWGALQPAVLILVINGTVAYFFYSGAKIRAIREAAEKERVNRLASEKEALEANLRLLQAQIEPHFLFNTLSNVLSLIDTEPAKGKSMLMDLMHYLRTTLSRTLPDATTLDQEMDNVRAYLNIQKIRLGDRLNFKINVPETLRQHPFPPMLVQPLVENAVKHGLEPKVTGGEISIAVSDKSDLIRITVADTGLGFSSLNATGLGIANVKNRLQLIYGGKGRLLLEENEPAGVLAAIEVPKNGL